MILSNPYKVESGFLRGLATHPHPLCRGEPPPGGRRLYYCHHVCLFIPLQDHNLSARCRTGLFKSIMSHVEMYGHFYCGEFWPSGWQVQNRYLKIKNILFLTITHQFYVKTSFMMHFKTLFKQ